MTDKTVQQVPGRHESGRVSEKNALRALNVLKAQLYKSYISGCGRAAGGASVGLDGRSGQLLLGKSPVGRLRGPVGDWLA